MGRGSLLTLCPFFAVGRQGRPADLGKALHLLSIQLQNSSLTRPTTQDPNHAMKYMFEWQISPGLHKPAALEFLKTGAPMPEGLTVVGRWHAPGSSRGWLVVDADDIAPVAEHAAEWADYLEIEVTPVVEDEVAGQAMAKVYGE